MKRKQKNTFVYVVLFSLVLALILTNTCVYLRLSSLSASRPLALLPGNLKSRAAELAYILMLNNVALTGLAGILLVKRLW